MVPLVPALPDPFTGVTVFLGSVSVTLLSLFGGAFAPRAAAGLRDRAFICGAVCIKARQCA